MSDRKRDLKNCRRTGRLSETRSQDDPAEPPFARRSGSRLDGGDRAVVQNRRNLRSANPGSGLSQSFHGGCRGQVRRSTPGAGQTNGGRRPPPTHQREEEDLAAMGSLSAPISLTLAQIHQLVGGTLHGNGTRCPVVALQPERRDAASTRIYCERPRRENPWRHQGRRAPRASAFSRPRHSAARGAESPSRLCASGPNVFCAAAGAARHRAQK